VIAAAACDAVLASVSRPFTARADITTGVGIGGALLLGAAARWCQRPAELGTEASSGPSLSRAAVAAWSILVAAIAALEIVNFLGKPRAIHPTISSLLNSLTGHEVLRGLLFAAWLGAGWWLWRRT
jgi:hypothetical protein